MTDETVDRLIRFRAEAASRGLPSEEVEEWIRVTLPAVYMAEGGDGALVARVGGDPLLPHGVPKPSDPFVASVDLAALPPKGGYCPMLYAPVTAHARGQWNGRPVEYTETFSNGCVMAGRTGSVFALDG